MPFVKIDCGMVNSTIWYDHDARILFLTALLMAEPREYSEPVPELDIRENEPTGWCAPAGWYGFVPSSAQGIISRAGGVDVDAGYAALDRLRSPEKGSRSPLHDGRRMIRVDGGYLVLNYDRYRQRDYTNAERQKRLRDRRNALRNGGDALQGRDVTQAEAEAEAEAEEKNLFSVAPPPRTKRIFQRGEPEFDLADRLLGKIRKRNPEHKADLQRWAREVDVMIRRDGRRPDIVAEIIDWCQADAFWQNNILSPAKLRAQFDQLLLKRAASKSPPRSDAPRTIRRAPGPGEEA